MNTLRRLRKSDGRARPSNSKGRSYTLVWKNRLNTYEYRLLAQELAQAVLGPFICLIPVRTQPDRLSLSEGVDDVPLEGDRVCRIRLLQSSPSSPFRATLNLPPGLRMLLFPRRHGCSIKSAMSCHITIAHNHSLCSGLSILRVLQLSEDVEENIHWAGQSHPNERDWRHTKLSV